MRRATPAPVARGPDAHISIHALLAESDCSSPLMWPWSPLFLSTLSLRRATVQAESSTLRSLNFYPRSPCGERPRGHRLQWTLWRISIHALLAESDQKESIAHKTFNDFYPRSPCGERLTGPKPYLGILALFLSTLSLRRATQRSCERVHKLFHFYPRSPCGERLVALLAWRNQTVFLSTLSLRRATAEPHNNPEIPKDFYPRSPCGERQPAKQ